MYARRIVIAGLGMMLWGTAAHAELADEIQVYTDEINHPRNFGLEMHLNTTPSGRETADFPGEVVPQHGVRLTPEFSYALNEHWELGAYVPMVRDGAGNYYAPSLKARVKWLPFPTLGGDEGQGWYGGLNVELAKVDKKFEAVAWSSEFRFIAGYRTQNWLFGFNPILGKDWSDGTLKDAPAFDLGIKITRRFTHAFSAGIETYNDFGALDNMTEFSQQPRTLYAVIDFDNEVLPFNVGVGRGLTSATDAWTVKAIFEIEFH